MLARAIPSESSFDEVNVKYNFMEELRNIFASSCIEAAARKLGCNTGQMYRRMKRVGLIHGFILPGYEALHSQSREHVTEDVLGALRIWEQKQGIVVMQ